MRGRKPYPAERHEAAGTYQHDPKRRRKAEPVAPEGPLRCPDHLDATAQAAWVALCETLDTLGVLSPAYERLIERWAVHYSKWLLCTEKVAELGPVVEVTGPKGRTEVKRSPWSSEQHKFAAELTRMEIELCLTPAAKARVSTARPGANPDDHFFN